MRFIFGLLEGPAVGGLWHSTAVCEIMLRDVWWLVIINDVILVINDVMRPAILIRGSSDYTLNDLLYWHSLRMSHLRCGHDSCGKSQDGEGDKLESHLDKVNDYDSTELQMMHVELFNGNQCNQIIIHFNAYSSLEQAMAAERKTK